MNIKIIFVLLVLLVIGGAISVFTPQNENNQIACTMEAKLCPDGSAVGRTGPKCEFAACPGISGGGGGGGGILPYKSGISGIVLRGPMCPVMRDPPDPNCADQPYSAEVSVSRAGYSAPFAKLTSGKDGKFQFNIPPGDYVVSAVNNGISKTCSPVRVAVKSEELGHITINCDTGIR